MLDHIKHYGQIFTPEYLVDNILDTASYQGMDILQKHCMDNSCGDGAFLCKIISRYAAAYLSQNPANLVGLKHELETYIHGIEKDSAAYDICICNLNFIAKDFGIANIKWDIHCTDALSSTEYYGKMDFVVGNPPYVRVHNLESDYSTVKTFQFSQGGMTDLFLVFFELGFRMLSQHGKLCYITPSSWINSLAGLELRRYIQNHRNLVKLIDLEHYQPFNATTYTLISLFENGICNQTFSYSGYDSEKHVEKPICQLEYDDAFINNILFLAEPDTLKKLRSILTDYAEHYVSVKNGFATLADDIFIRSDFPFQDHLIPVIKASTGKWYKALFLYDSTGKPLPRDQIFQSKEIAKYLEENQHSLLKGKSKEDCPDWYLFGRTQALKDVCKAKYSINTCIRDLNSIKFYSIPAGVGVYSGLYILTDIDEFKLKRTICSEDFLKYIRSLKKYKSGGYYTFNSKDLEVFLNFAFSEENNFSFSLSQ